MKVSYIIQLSASVFPLISAAIHFFFWYYFIVSWNQQIFFQTETTSAFMTWCICTWKSAALFYWQRCMRLCAEMVAVFETLSLSDCCMREPAVLFICWLWCKRIKASRDLLWLTDYDGIWDKRRVEFKDDFEHCSLFRSQLTFFCKARPHIPLSTSPFLLHPRQGVLGYW